MFWDIVIAVLLAVLAALVSILGGYLAATRTWHKWFFWITGALMVVLIGVQTYRNEIGQAGLQKQLDAIQKNTEQPQPAPVVNVNPTPVNFPPQEAYVTVVGRSLVQFHVGLPVVLDFTTENLSPAVPALNQYGFDQMYFVETDHLGPGGELAVSNTVEEKYYKTFLGTIAKERPGSSRTLGPQQTFISSRYGAPLDENLEKEIESGSKAVLHAMEFVWADGAGQHINEACEWLQPQSFTPGTPFKSGTSEVWHYCNAHNGLRK